MKLHDFGLWFKCWDSNTQAWNLATTPPKEEFFYIFYDGLCLGQQRARNPELYTNPWMKYKIKLKTHFQEKPRGIFYIGRHLTLDDFEIIEDPEYTGDK